MYEYALSARLKSDKTIQLNFIAIIVQNKTYS